MFWPLQHHECLQPHLSCLRGWSVAASGRRGYWGSSCFLGVRIRVKGWDIRTIWWCEYRLRSPLSRLVPGMISGVVLVWNADLKPAESGERGQNPDALSHLVHSDIPATIPISGEQRKHTRFSSPRYSVLSLFIPSCPHAGLLDNRQLCSVLYRVRSTEKRTGWTNQTAAFYRKANDACTSGQLTSIMPPK